MNSIMTDSGTGNKPHKLSLHLSNAREIPYDPEKKWVIFSDLHMGNGGRNDDFARNTELFNTVIAEYYLSKKYTLILNGDIEELHKFTWKQVFNAHGKTFALFDAFAGKNMLIKTVGNHDSRLIMDLRDHYRYEMDTVVNLTGQDYPVLIYHGHQVSALYERFNDISRIGVRYFAMPLGIMNYSVAHDSRKRHYMEKRIYEYSRREQIISIIGHTHRPLFESLTKAETLRFQIEFLLNRYRKTHHEGRPEIEDEIRRLRKEMVEWRSRKRRPDLQSGIYDEDDIPVPCMFNSGTVIGKRGMTCLELTGGRIKLIHWFDDRVQKNYADPGGHRLKTLPDTPVHRVELRSATLEYIMDSIRLLS